MARRLSTEIQQEAPFGSPEEEAFLNLLRTASLLEQAVMAVLKPYGLSATQYNALRILRGAGPRGLACQEIARRMLTRDPDITRLLDRLEARQLVQRARSAEDRRVVLTQISEAGLRLLASTDPVVRDLPKQILGHLGEHRLEVFIDLLERAREGLK